ncbi:putative plant non-specific lipid-transfer protein/Par allergen [Helianthus debilis subsp. tardiflorus]
MANSSSLTLTLTVALLLVTAAIPAAQAQAQTCASKLVPCAAYLNATTTPPNTCCDPIKEAVANDLQCLCNLYSNPAFLSGLGINIQQALRLPRLCGVSSDTSVCKSVQAPNVSSPKPPPASTQGQSSASKISSSAVTGLLFVLACMLLF